MNTTLVETTIGDLQAGDRVQYDSATIIDGHHWIWQGTVISITWKYARIEWTRANSAVFADQPIAETDHWFGKFDRWSPVTGGTLSLIESPALMTVQEEQQQQESETVPTMKLSRITEFYCHGYQATRVDGLKIEILRSYPGCWFVYTAMNGVGGTHHTNGLRQDVPYLEALGQAKAIFQSR
jgi:hypothetical protein